MRPSPGGDVHPHHVAALLESGALLIDVREHEEWEAGHAPSALHAPLGELDPSSLPRAPALIALCRSGSRSAFAVELLRVAGLPAHNLVGGMSAWAAAGLPVTRDDGTDGWVL